MRSVAGSTVEIDAATGIASGDVVYVCGTTLADGFYTATLVDATHYSLVAKTDWTGTFAELGNCGTGIIGKIRYPNAPAICGRIKVLSAVQSGGSVNIVLAADATTLFVGDYVDFTGVGFLGSSVAITAKTDDTHFTVSGTVGSYAGGGYISSSGAPDYYWNDS